MKCEELSSLKTLTDRMMAEGFLEKVLERLPYSDGAGRRRIVAGGIVFIAGTFLQKDAFPSSLAQMELKEILTSPIIIAVCLLLIYAIGSIVELIGEIFLARAASGVLWGLSFPMRKINYESKALRYVTRGVLWFLGIPILLAEVHLFLSFFGYPSYRIMLNDRLSERAKQLYNTLPEKVADGLSQPVGDNAELACKYVVEKMQDEKDRKWALYSVNRSKDVLAITSALFIAFTIFIVSDKMLPSPSPVSLKLSVPLSVEQKLNEIESGINTLVLTPGPREYLMVGIRNYRTAINSGDRGELGMLIDRNELLERFNEIAASKIAVSDEDKQRISELKIRVSELRSNLQDWLDSWRNEQFLVSLKLWGFTSLFFLLYAGFFVTLRNTIVNILEVTAMK